MEVMLSSLSLRAESYNLKLVKIIAEMVQSFANTANIIDLNQYNIPYYNQEIEERAIPSSVMALKEHMDHNQALILAAPEYNYSMPGHFKNTLDWLSRCKPQPFKDKPILLVSASPSLVAGNRGLWALRVPLEALGGFVFPTMFSLPLAFEAFTAEQQLKDEQHFKNLQETVKAFMLFAQKLAV